MIVSYSKIAFMIVSFIIETSFLFGTFFFVKYKYPSMKRPFILGIITFLIFALFLEQILHFFVLRFFSVSSDLRIYAVYAAVSASLFEERFSFLFETSSLIYLLSAYERVITILLQIFLSIIMWKGINLQKRIIVSSVFFIHFFFDFICIILNNYFGILSTEIFITVFVLLFGLYSFKIYRRS